MKKHMKRLNAPRTLRIHRKENTWTVKPSPGPHSNNRSIPLGVILRDYLKIADTIKETKKILSTGEIFIDGTVKKDYKYPVGFMDVISINKLKKNYRLLFDQRGKLTLVPTSSKDAKWKLCRVENKTTLKGNKTQLNLHDGKNKIVDKDKYKTGEVLKITFDGQKVEDKYDFGKGTVSMIIGGSHIGEIANIENLETIQSPKSNIAKMKGKTEFTTIQEYVFPIGKQKPVIEIPEVKVK